MDILEMDEGGYVDTFFLFSDTKEGWKLQFYINLSIFDTGQNCPTENFDGANLDMDPINLFHQCQPRSHGGWYQMFQKMY